MIPKNIHFCWFGNSAKSSEIIDYMNTWEILGDFKIIEWNDKNVKFDERPYLNNMYSKKKWAFVSDYVRLKALYEYGVKCPPLSRHDFQIYPNSSFHYAACLFE